MPPENAVARPTEQPPEIRDYSLLRKIGSGSYGDVWLARTAAGGFRAIKVVYRSRFRDPRPYEREFEGLRHFEQITLRDRNQLALLHLSRDDSLGLFYYVMELADDLRHGVEIDPDRYEPATLANVQKQHPYLPAAQTLRIGVELARGLDTLHRHGVVHRDVKPANVIFVGGTAKLADIGLLAAESTTDSFVGTEGYVPPEGPGRPMADVYALGRLLYECATGLGRHDYPRLPPGFDQRPDKDTFLELNLALIRACDSNPQVRYQTAGEMLQDLLRASSLSLRAMQRREVVRRWMRLSLLGVLIAFAAGSALLWRVRESERQQRRDLASTMAANAFRTADDGDPVGALPWLAGAAKHLDRLDPLRARFLDRTAALLEQAPHLQILHAYPASINDLHFHPHLPLLAVATESGAFDLWDVPSRNILLSTSPWHPSPTPQPTAAQSFRFSPDGTLAALADEKGHFRLTRFNPAHPSLTPIDERAFGSAVTSIAFAPRDDRVAIATADTLTLARVDRSSLEIIATHHRPAILTVAWSRDGERLACSCREAGVFLYSRADDFTTPRHLPHPAYIYASTFAAEGQTLYSATSIGDVLERDLGGKLIRTYEHEGAVTGIDLSTDGAALLTAARDGFLRRWNVRTIVPRPLKLPQLPVAVIAAGSPDQRYSAGGGLDGQLGVWDHLTPALPPRVPSEPTYFVHLQPWRASDLARLPGPSDETAPLVTPRADFADLVSADLAPDGSSSACYVLTNGLVHFWKTRSPKPSPPGPSLLPTDITNVFGLEAGRGLALGLTASNHLVLWSAATRTVTWRSEHPIPRVHWSFFSHDRRWWAWTLLGEAHLLDLNHSPTRPIPLATHGPTANATGHIALAFSPDNRWMAIGCSTHAEEPCPVAIYSLTGPSSPTLVTTLNRHRDGIRSLRFSPNSQLLASGGEDGLVFIWNVRDWRPTGDPLPHRGQVQRLEFSPDSTELLTGTRSRFLYTDVLRIWEVRTGIASSSILQLGPGLNATRVGYAPWLDSWVWAHDYPATVATTPARLFSPRTRVETADWLLETATVLSGREIGTGQQELTLSSGDRLLRYREVLRRLPKLLASP